MEVEKPESGYLTDKQLTEGILALRKYITKKDKTASVKRLKKDLLEAGRDENSTAKVLIDVVFKNMPANERTYIHNIVLPHHWRMHREPEDLNIALFVKHRQPENEAQKIQFIRDRDLDIHNTHSYYKNLLKEKLNPELFAKISKIISTKELATEHSTPKQLDKLSKSYNLFISDKQLMSNKMNSLPRRLGRRFWVRERKVPLMVKLDGKDLNERFTKAFNTEPFYVTGRSSNERFQIGTLDQSDEELIENMKVFFDKLFTKSGAKVRFIRIRTDEGMALPLYADLSEENNCK